MSGALRGKPTDVISQTHFCLALVWCTLLHLKCRQTEIAEFERFAKQDKVHDAIFQRIAPNIFGAEDIKKAVACLLMGGSRKVCLGVRICGGVPWRM